MGWASLHPTSGLLWDTGALECPYCVTVKLTLPWAPLGAWGCSLPGHQGELGAVPSALGTAGSLGVTCPCSPYPAIFCDYYNPPNECEWHYEPCGNRSFETCRTINGIHSNISVSYLEGEQGTRAGSWHGTPRLSRAAKQLELRPRMGRITW